MASNYVPDQLGETGLYLQQTPIFDVQALIEAEVSSGEFKELLVRLYQQVNNISIAVNLKTTGLHLKEEYRNGNNYFPTEKRGNYAPNQLDYRAVFQKEVDFGALPNAATKSVAHNIPISDSTVAGVNPYICVGLRGFATKPDTAGIGIRWIPLPYATETANGDIEVYVTATDVVVTTSIDYSAFTKTTFVLEYLKK
jgi:hypothetical protein